MDKSEHSTKAGMTRQVSYADIRERARRLLPEFSHMVATVPYERKGILNSELLFFISSLPEPFTGRVFESGRARAQSTLILSLALPNSHIFSVELDERSPDIPVAAARLQGRNNVTLLFGDSRILLPKLAKEGDIVLIDGPKMFRAVRLAINMLRMARPLAVFIHDVSIETPERAFLNRFFPEALFSDRRDIAQITASIDVNATETLPPRARLGGFDGAYGYGFALAYIPYIPGRPYTLLLLASYAFDILERILRKMGMRRRI
ncbi:MAG: hypothetical protein Q7S09_03660 [bacterium]|nr:hypothetical protein [bacterium]